MVNYHGIDTKYGKATVAPTGNGHIYFDANKNSGGDMGVGLTVRGVRYGVSVHLYRWADGAFHVGSEGETGGVYSHDLYVSRAGSYNSPVSVPARKSILEEVEKVVNAWAGANLDTLSAANLASVESELESKLGDLKKAKEAVDKLLLDIAELQGKRFEAQKAIA
jgi:hypothetical protein